MKYLLLLLALIPNIVSAAFTVPLTATTTSNPLVYPAPVNGLYPSVISPYYIATSTTASSTFANGLNLTSGCFAVGGTCLTFSGGGVGTSTNPFMATYFVATSTTATSTFPNIWTNNISAVGSAGFDFHSNNGTLIGRFGAGGGSNATLYGGLSLDTMTQGSVLFSGSSGLVSQDNSNFFWDDTNNRLGIGTNNPSAKLDITTTAGDYSRWYNVLTSDTSSPAFGTLQVFGVENYKSTGSTANTYAKHWHVQNDMTSGSSGGFAFTTIIPSTSTFSSTWSGINANFRTESTGSMGSLQGLNLGVIAAGSGATLANLLGLTFVATPIAPVTVTGSVIGIRADARAGSSASTIGSVIGLDVMPFFNNGGTVTNTYGVHVGDITTGTQTNTPYSFYASDANAYNYFAGNTGIGTTTPWGKLSVTQTGANPSFVVEDSTSPDSTPFIIDASGNVGIGTASPTYKLVVKGSGSDAVAQFIPNSVSEMGLAITDSTISRSLRFYTQTIGAVAGNSIYTDTAVPLEFGTNSTSRLYIASAGNVGIGTTTPTSALTVNGNVRFNNTEDASDYFSVSSINSDGRMAFNQVNDGGAVKQIFAARASSDCIAFGSDTTALGEPGCGGLEGAIVQSQGGLATRGLTIGGLPGVGTHKSLSIGTPYSLAHNASSSMSMIDVYTTSWIANANVGQRPGIHFSALSYAFGVGDNAGGTGDGYSTRALTIASTTEVGIGTTTPWGKLSVTQTGTAGAPAFIVEDSASPDTTPFIIDQTGNVGIGTTSPSTKLEINNSMAFTSEHNQTSSSNAVTVDWTTGNYQQINTLTEDTTITFVAPNNKKAVGQLQIRFVMDGVGGYNVTWPASVKWPGGTAPTLTMFAGTSDIIGFWYDGTNYYNNYTMLDVR